MEVQLSLIAAMTVKQNAEAGRPKQRAERLQTGGAEEKCGQVIIFFGFVTKCDPFQKHE